MWQFTHQSGTGYITLYVTVRDWNVLIQTRPTIICFSTSLKKMWLMMNDLRHPTDGLHMWCKQHHRFTWTAIPPRPSNFLKNFRHGRRCPHSTCLILWYVYTHSKCWTANKAMPMPMPMPMHRHIVHFISALCIMWSVVAERSSLPDSSSGVSSRMWVRIPAVTLVSLSKTLNHNCFSPPRG